MRQIFSHKSVNFRENFGCGSLGTFPTRNKSGFYTGNTPYIRKIPKFKIKCFKDAPPGGAGAATQALSVILTNCHLFDASVAIIKTFVVQKRGDFEQKVCQCRRSWMELDVGYQEDTENFGKQRNKVGFFFFAPHVVRSHFCHIRRIFSGRQRKHSVYTVLYLFICMY